MHAKLKSRVATLEKTMPKPTPPAAAAQSGVPLLVARLAAKGFVIGPNESPAEMIARAMGMTPRELRAEFQRRAGLS